MKREAPDWVIPWTRYLPRPSIGQKYFTASPEDFANIHIWIRVVTPTFTGMTR